jgi:shikimate kinase
MKRVLITGMSGTGKSSVIRELAARGYRAYDLDTPEWSQWVDAAASDTLTPAQGKDWVWREGRVRELLSIAEDGTLFVGGCAENMRRLFPLIDTVILLSAPVETIMERLKARSPGSYGNTPEDQEKVSELVSTIEPLLRESAHYEIDTRGRVADKVDEILRTTAARPARAPRSARSGVSAPRCR